MFDPVSFRRPVVFFANGIGDHLIALPALRALACMFDGRLSLICLDRVDVEFFSDINFRHIWTLPFPDIAPGQDWQYRLQKVRWLSFDHAALSTQIGHCDLFISLARWQSPSLSNLLRSISAPVSIGYFPEYSHCMVETGENCFDRYFDIANLFDPSLEPDRFSEGPLLCSRNKLLASNLRSELGKMRLLIVHTDTKKRKMWSGTKFLETVDGFLSARPDYIAIVLGNYHEIPVDLAKNKCRIFSLCGIPIGLSLALISVADLFLGVDSCLLHAADLNRVPGVGIFGPTDFEKWGFRFAPHFHFRKEDMNEIEPEQVIAKMQMIVGN